jgi:hypothetical protein
MKVFRVNEYDWVAAHSLEEAKSWYLENIDSDEEWAFDEVYLGEVDIHKVKMWYPVTNIPQEIKEQAPPYEVKDFGGELFAHLTFSQVLEIDKPTEPYIIASTEY